jgi:hypothetical protein
VLIPNLASRSCDRIEAGLVIRAVVPIDPELLALQQSSFICYPLDDLEPECLLSVFLPCALQVLGMMFADPQQVQMVVPSLADPDGRSDVSPATIHVEDDIYARHV